MNDTITTIQYIHLSTSDALYKNSYVFLKWGLLGRSPLDSSLVNHSSTVGAGSKSLTDGPSAEIRIRSSNTDTLRLALVLLFMRFCADTARSH